MLDMGKEIVGLASSGLDLDGMHRFNLLVYMVAMMVFRWRTGDIRYIWKLYLWNK